VSKGNIMRTITYSTENLVQLFQKEKVVTLNQIKYALGTAIKMTVFRKLKSLNYKASYSHAGKYYTLDDIANYNKLGLWEFKQVYFSKFGSLKHTIETLVCLSEAGYSAAELIHLLKIRVQKPLLQLYSTGSLYREQIGSSYHYFSPQRYDLQKGNRFARIESSLQENVPEQASAFMSPGIQQSLDVFLSNLNEKQRRLYLGFESMKLGSGGDTIMAQITGVNIKTIAKGRNELKDHDITPDRIRKTGGGRHPIKKN